MSAGADQLFINGRFLTRKMTGTERFAYEIVRALDALLVVGERDIRVTLLAPPGARPMPGLKYIDFLTVGTRQGHLWEQSDLVRAARGGFLINPASCGPLFKRDQLTVTHDAAVYRRPKNYAFAYRSWHRVLGLVLSRFSRLATVSVFSQAELAAVLHIPAASILIVSNGHEHILSTAPESGVIEKLELENRPYFLFVGSPTPNKNLARAIAAFQTLGRPDARFVIVGAAQAGLFQNELSDLPTNIIMPGRLSDGEIVGLYRHAAALVFPSLYEGFGIPPLEAMAQGCPVIAARIPAVQEVCGDAALYFDPYAPQEIAVRMRSILDSAALRDDLIAKGGARYPRFSWQTGARSLLWSF